MPSTSSMEGKQVFNLGLVAIGSLTCLGFYSEVCDIIQYCPPRLAFLIAAGVISLLLSAVVLVGLVMQLDVLAGATVYMCGFLALWWGVTAGVASSPRTYDLGTLNVGLLSVWLAFLAALAATIGAATEAGWFSGPGGREGATDAEEAEEEEKARPGSESTENEPDMA